VQRPEKPETERNSSGDELWTDGSLAVLELSDCETPATAAIPPTDEIARRPKSRLKRLVRAQVLSIHDLWRSNAIYTSFDISRAVIHFLRQRHVREYETKGNLSIRTASNGSN
jgi:hypothetical protein